MPALAKYETCPKIDLQLLIENGMLTSQVTDLIYFESAGVPMRFIYLPPARYPRREPELHVMFEYEEYLIYQQIGIGFANTNKGKLPYLTCPASGARCNDLYLYDYRFVSRRSHPELSPKKPPPAHRREVALMRKRDRVVGTGGHPPATGEERTKLIAELQEIPLLQFRWPELGPHYEAEDRRRQRVRKAATRDPRRTGVTAPMPACAAVDLKPRRSIWRFMLRYPQSNGLPRFRILMTAFVVNRTPSSKISQRSISVLSQDTGRSMRHDYGRRWSPGPSSAPLWSRTFAMQIIRCWYCMSFRHGRASAWLLMLSDWCRRPMRGAGSCNVQ
jgi:hypothetical protein